MTFTLRPYDESRDLESVVELWNATIGDQWPMRADLFARVTTRHRRYQPGDHFLAEAGGQLVGFAGTQIERTPGLDALGGISVLLVHPSARRQGIGSALHAAALQRLKEAGMLYAGLFAGGQLRFWSGLPADLSDSRGFFEKQGWQEFNTCYDMVRALDDFEISPLTRQRMVEHGVTLRPAREEETPAVERFIGMHFPYWKREYGCKIEDGDYDEILVALKPGHGVVGSLVTYTSASRSLGANVVWKTLLGEDVGGLGAVGVAPEMRGLGIGLALVEYASELLKTRGVKQSHIDWLSIRDFYAKVGYRVWREYQNSFREV